MSAKAVFRCGKIKIFNNFELIKNQNIMLFFIFFISCLSSPICDTNVKQSTFFICSFDMIVNSHLSSVLDFGFLSFLLLLCPNPTWHVQMHEPDSLYPQWEVDLFGSFLSCFYLFSQICHPVHGVKNLIRLGFWC